MILVYIGINQLITRWRFQTLFVFFPFHICHVILPIDELIFFKMFFLLTTNQLWFMVEVNGNSKPTNITGGTLPCRIEKGQFASILQCGAPKIAKLVYNSNNYGLWYL